MAAEKGLKEAFVAFAAEGAVINRNDSIISGRMGISQYMDRPSTLKDIQLVWAPDYIDVSEAGDMAWTWGHYTFSASDSSGNPVSSKGIFHTVWKRQADGTWKYVYD